MERINIGIITNVRKLLFAYRTLFSEHINSPAKIVFEAPSIESISSNSDLNETPELLLLDYRLVFKDTALFFSLVNHHYPNMTIFLIVDQPYIREAQRCKKYIHSFLPPNLDVLQLFMRIRNSTLLPSFIKVGWDING